MNEVAARNALEGVLHAYVAFDWGEEIDLGRAGSLVPAEPSALLRRRRTPSSIAYRPAPLKLHLNSVPITLPGIGPAEASAEATVFDFGAVSIGLHIPLAVSPEELARVASHLADPQLVLSTAKTAMEPLFSQLLSAIQNPDLSELTEEYFVFQLLPDSRLTPAMLLTEHSSWLASLLRLEAEPLSSYEVAEATRLFLSYGPNDFFVAEWSAAVLVDRDCEETLQIIEFANVQLLEFRFIDDYLDRRLADAYRVIHPLVHTWLPFWKTQSRPLRLLGDLKIGVHELFDRTSNALKLVGDQYLARIHRLLATRFHLEQWEQNIRHSIEVAEGTYRILSDQASNHRMEFLEIIIILLIAYEIVAAALRL